MYLHYFFLFFCLVEREVSRPNLGSAKKLRVRLYLSLCDYQDAQCEDLDEGKTFLRSGLSLEAARRGRKEGNSVTLRKAREHELDPGLVPWFFFFNLAMPH